MSEKMEIDARGKACPLPVVETRKALLNHPDMLVRTCVDNEIAVQNLQKMAAHMGFFSEVIPNGEEYYVEIGGDAQTCEVSLEVPQKKEGEMVVVLSSSFMGEGDPKLGGILMKGFIFALTQLDDAPDAVLLYNGGARLSTEGSESIADLKTLEDRGTEILTCGTCLDYFGLKDKLVVGDMTNMYTIAERMAGAARLLKP